jgi:subtilase family serine protease
MSGSFRQRMVASSLAATAVGLAFASALAGGAGASANSSRSVQATLARSVKAAGPVPEPFLHILAVRPFAKPPTNAYCEEVYGAACYNPAQLRAAYNLDPLLTKGDTGTGETIVLVDAFGSPDIASDLATFDTSFKIPAPPSFNIIAPAGTIPPFTGTTTQVNWAEETSLDVEYSHAMAPGANILLVETPVAETEGAAGFKQIVKAENYVIKNHLGQVISQSFGATESTFKSGQILGLRSAFTAAQAANVTVLGASGDTGATNYTNTAGTTLSTTPVNSWPSSDPLVTSVGGLHFFLNAKGAQTQQATVWNDTALLGSPAAGGGGDSAVFARPAFQSGVSSVVGADRGTPDVAMSASVDGGALVYLSADISPFGIAGFVPIGGTSEATPEFAGIVAIADQVAGKSLGYLNPALYAMAAANDPGLVDITKGNNTVSFDQGGKNVTVTGFTAVAGYDMASGLGTVNAVDFVPELVAEVNALAAKHTS